jgi:dTDP-4-dehydrorhamnose 3,5-epimerase
MSKHLRVLDTPLEGLKIIQRCPIADDRGYFEPVFCSSELQSLTKNVAIAQINHTLTTKRGSVRGMHYQRPPRAETKFISCVRGEIFDVAVDLRVGSPTRFRWHAEILSDRNNKTLVVPEGFAHGFQTLVDDCELLFLHTAAYCASAEAGLNVRDAALKIDWPFPIANLSARDEAHPMMSRDFAGLAT